MANVVSFVHMKDGTREEYQMLHNLEKVLIHSPYFKLVRVFRLITEN